jgi:hypothetical protein
MLDDWIQHCLDLDLQRPDFTLSNRRVFSGRMLEFSFPCDVTLKDAGYTQRKIQNLYKSYYAEEWHRGAIELWNARGEKPGSASFSTFKESTKAHAGSSRISSRIAPCLLGVTVNREPHRYTVDAYYRSTEFHRKFPADLIFLAELVEPFKLPPETTLRCFFSNIVVNSLYAPQILTYLTNPVAHLRKVKQADPAFHKNLLRVMRYVLVDDTGMRNFAQGLRAIEFTRESLTPKQKRELTRYLEEQDGS